MDSFKVREMSSVIANFFKEEDCDATQALAYLSAIIIHIFVANKIPIKDFDYFCEENKKTLIKMLRLEK